MLFSHLSDTHLGFVQYHSEERENDVYSAFNEAIGTSIKDHVDFVLFAGDIFHVPNPSGTAIVTLANALKSLKENSIESFFILGEHDISRIRATPVPYVYHNLKFSRYIGQGKPFVHKGVMIAGFDKRRKGEVDALEKEFAEIDKAAQAHQGHRILVLHQGISEINKFAGELSATDLPKNFSYYAMGHLHDHDLKRFAGLGGPLAYPGSIEVTSSETIKETEKGFYEVDISGPEALPTWVKVDTRPQIASRATFETLAEEVSRISDEAQTLARKPIVEIRVTGKIEDPSAIQAQIARLADVTLRCFWRHVSDEAEGSVFMQKPARVEDEMHRIAREVLGSEEMANFAINELLPALSRGGEEEASRAIGENYLQFKKGLGNAALS
ncbi:MAG TPA: exonuclease SbcCD subunit D [Candidatus Nitrosotalea sp.]|nr:exonuclease SbcCD subunit D [Candidatus Nitrosotalea sp.]